MTALQGVAIAFAGILAGFWVGTFFGYFFAVSQCRDLYRAGKLPKSFTEGRK